MQPRTRLDHLVFVVPELQPAVERIRRAWGCDVLAGGLAPASTAAGPESQGAGGSARSDLELLLRLYNGPPRLYGLPEPDHPFGATHPTVNSELLYFLRHGETHPRPDVDRFHSRHLQFVAGTSGEYDAVIACTGFVTSHPFFPPGLIDYSKGPVPLYLKMIHPRFDNLHFIGLLQPLGCIWPLAELQSRIMARRLAGSWSPPAKLDEAIRREMENPDLRQLDTPRHTITVDYPSFRKRLPGELAS